MAFNFIIYNIIKPKKYKHTSFILQFARYGYAYTFFVLFTLYCLLLSLYALFLGYHGKPLPKWRDVPGPAFPSGGFGLQLRQWAWRVGLSRIQRCEFNRYTILFKSLGSVRYFFKHFNQKGCIQLIKWQLRILHCYKKILFLKSHGFHKNIK